MLLLDKLINYLVDRKSPLSWADYQMNKYLNKRLETQVENYVEVSSILSKEILDFKDKFSSRVRK